MYTEQYFQQRAIIFQTGSRAPLALLIESCIAPIGEGRHGPVVLYFYHVHALCPAVDEFNFTRLYSRYRDEAELINHIELPLFQAMMFAAFAVSIHHFAPAIMDMESLYFSISAIIN
jgi:hypothetical protein